MKCTKSCQNGNPYRHVICQCRGCKGSSHGATKVTIAMLEQFADIALRNPEIGKADRIRWEAVLTALLSYDPKRRRRHLRVA